MRLQVLVRRIYPWAVLAAVAGGVLLLQATWLARAAPPSQSVEDGQAIFDRLCASCHTIGGGDLSGPDLAGVTAERDPAWLRRWLAEPDVMLAEGDPIALELLHQYNNIPMPNQNLSSADIDALMVYLGAAESGAQPAAPAQDAAAAQDAVTGDADAGHDLFTGADRFANGGSACITCHDVATLRTPGGGQMGADLTGVLARYGGEAGLAGVLANIPFPTMRPIYSARPLTPQEQADLVAFFQRADAEPAPDQTVRTVVVAILAFVAFDVFLVLVYLWVRRMPQDRRRVRALR